MRKRVRLGAGREVDVAPVYWCVGDRGAVEIRPNEILARTFYAGLVVLLTPAEANRLADALLVSAAQARNATRAPSVLS